MLENGTSSSGRARSGKNIPDNNVYWFENCKYLVFLDSIQASIFRQRGQLHLKTQATHLKSR